MKQKSIYAIQDNLQQCLVITVGGKSALLCCTVCHKEFYHLDSLKKHVSNLHGEARGPFVCSMCGRTMKNKNSLYAHIYNYHKRWASVNCII